MHRTKVIQILLRLPHFGSQPESLHNLTATRADDVHTQDLLLAALANQPVLALHLCVFGHSGEVRVHELSGMDLDLVLPTFSFTSPSANP